ncbi:MAG TPA: alkaline phosphatase [Bacteroidales bacterium]|nr:alkaline phosphatase [Bacteroidales bacterium]
MSLLNDKIRRIQGVVLLSLIVLVPFVLQAANQDKRLVLQQSKELTGRVDRPVRPVKNVILLIPDGTSLATVSAARWYQWLLNPDKPVLFIDPYLCGTVRTNSINAPIGDSAPTTSTYMTGELSRTGFVATYPPADGANDIFKVDSTKAYQPLMTVLEASRLLYGKSVGLAFTCEFPHATPADCSSHDYSRGNYDNITKQMAHNQLDVVLGGGTSFLKAEDRDFLKENGYTVQFDDLNGLRTFKGNKLWSLFGSREISFDLDRDTLKEPSLAELAGKAISILSQNKKGFFLMVEGSKVDWAAHANDPIGMMTEFLSFDRACKVALDFAKKDGNTAVIIVPDHGNSGISIGTSRMPGYDKLTKNQLFGPSLKVKKTSVGLADLLIKSPYAQRDSLFLANTGFELSEADKRLIDSMKEYTPSPVPVALRTVGGLSSYLNKVLTARSCFGFTTTGHTGEEVFLANYHPKGDIFKGVHYGFEVNDYLCSLLKLDGKLPELTKQYFAKHTDVFRGMNCSIKSPTSEAKAELTVTSGTNRLVLRQNSNVATLNGKDLQLSTVVVYVDKNQTFYLPTYLAERMK